MTTSRECCGCTHEDTQLSQHRSSSNINRSRKHGASSAPSRATTTATTSIINPFIPLENHQDQAVYEFLAAGRSEITTDRQGQSGCAGGDGEGNRGNQGGDGKIVMMRPGTSRPSTSRSARFEYVGVVIDKGAVPECDGSGEHARMP